MNEKPILSYRGVSICIDDRGEVTISGSSSVVIDLPVSQGPELKTLRVEVQGEGCAFGDAEVVLRSRPGGVQIGGRPVALMLLGGKVYAQNGIGDWTKQEMFFPIG